MPEIAEAQTLQTALAESDEVKKVILQRQRRLDLQTAYGHALSWGKGLGAEETKAAFARVAELAVSAENASARFVAYEGQFVSRLMRGELGLARDQAEIFLREAETDGRATEAGVARRSLGVVLLELGEMKSARSVLERALADYIPERDEETQFRFGRGTEVGAASYLAVAEWHMGEVERARQLIDRALRRADKLGSGAAAALALFWKVALEGHRQDVSLRAKLQTPCLRWRRSMA